MEFVWMALTLIVALSVFYFPWLNDRREGETHNLKTWWHEMTIGERFLIVGMVLMLGTPFILFHFYGNLDKGAQIVAEHQAEQRQREARNRLEIVVHEKAKAVVEGNMARANELQKEDDKLRKQLREN